MEITDETKYKVLLKYFGCKVKSTDMGIVHDWNTITDKTFQRFKEKSFQLVLKPPYAITDEDINEVIKIEYGQGDYPTIFRQEHYTKIRFKVKGLYETISFEKYFNGDPIKSEKRLINILIIYQYLQSKGYDLPQYLLGWKTLKEVELCIYDTSEE